MSRMMEADTIEKMAKLVSALSEEELNALNKETARAAANRAIVMMEEKVRLQKLIEPLTREGKLMLLEDVNDLIDELEVALVEYEKLPRLR